VPIDFITPFSMLKKLYSEPQNSRHQYVYYALTTVGKCGIQRWQNAVINSQYVSQSVTLWKPFTCVSAENKPAFSHWELLLVLAQVSWMQNVNFTQTAQSPVITP